MATLQSDAVKAGYMVVDGPVGHVIEASVKYVGKPASGDVVQLAPIPKGAMVTAIDFKWPAISSGAGTLGDGDDVDRYATPTLTSAGSGHYFAVNHIYDSEDTIDLAYTGTAPSSNVTFVANVRYKMVNGFIPVEAEAFKN